MIGSCPLICTLRWVFFNSTMRSLAFRFPGMGTLTSASFSVCVHLYGSVACSSSSLLRSASSCCLRSSGEGDAARASDITYLNTSHCTEVVNTTNLLSCAQQGLAESSEREQVVTHRKLFGRRRMRRGAGLAGKYSQDEKRQSECLLIPRQTCCCTKIGIESNRFCGPACLTWRIPYNGHHQGTTPIVRQVLRKRDIVLFTRLGEGNTNLPYFGIDATPVC
jgi:hypothetical protein